MKEMDQDKNNLLVYLAGAMENAPDSGSAWRQELSGFINKELRHRVFNPCLEESHVLTREEFHSFRKWKTTNLKRFREVVRKIIKTDLGKIIEEVDYINTGEYSDKRINREKVSKSLDKLMTLIEK